MRRRTVLAGLPALALSAPAIAQPDKASTLRLVPSSPLTALDPTWTSALVTTCHGYHVYDVLYALNSNLQPEPQMAAGHEVSADGRVWRIRLRDGLVFHDGTPVRGIDCAASLERWAKRDPFGQILARGIEKWGTLDDRTVEICLVRPFPMLLDAIAHPDPYVAFMMPERLARAPVDRALTEVIGSGPYRFLPDQFVAGTNAEYERFDRYVPRSEPADFASGGKVAHFERVSWHMIPDASTAVAALQRGEVDWIEVPPTDLIPILAKSRDVRVEVSNPSGLPGVMRLNTLQPPFDNAALRRAVMAATRQIDYLQAVYGDDAKQFWRTCTSMFPCGTAYGDEAAGRAAMPGLDDASAKKAIADAGYTGQRVVIINPTDLAIVSPLGQVTYDRLKRLGMNVDLQESDWGTVVQRRASRESVDRGGWSITHTYGSGTAWATPATSLIVRGLGEQGWFGWWNEPRAEELTRQWLEASDQAEATRLALALNKLAFEGAATIPLGMIYPRWAFRKSITDVLQGTVPYPWNVRPA